MKIHIGIGPATQEILLSKLTNKHSDDIDVANELIKAASFPIDKVYGDGLYDAEKIYQELWKRNSIPIIPTRKNARNRGAKKPRLFYSEKQISEIKGL
jgi:hypothetical protein